MRAHPPTTDARTLFEELQVIAARHLGRADDVRLRELPGVCADGETALELIAFWPAPNSRRSLWELAIADLERTLRRLAGDAAVTRDRLHGAGNIRILASGLAREVAVFGPGGDEIGDRLLVTVLAPCRPIDTPAD